MEFSEVMRQFDRMCAHYQPTNLCPLNCPMLGYNVSQCRNIMFERPDEVEKIVMRWAAENPEPVYPTWYDYLHSIGVLYNKHTAGGDVTEICWGYMMTPIPDDIAKKLGIEPKEG